MIAQPSLSDDDRSYLRAIGLIAIAPLFANLGRALYRVLREEHKAWLYRRMLKEHGVPVEQTTPPQTPESPK